ncbi:MAG: tRNA pseudouridine(55) synthase TruB [Firmicutes bacterium]|nr:tRNA pseudouridine(55) synthase TruB [Bacillota bacterium]
MGGGFVCVNKPPGMSSHDVVNWARRLFGIRRIGHTGTLDPGAAGVLVLAVGPATKVLEYMEGETKAYKAECTLGIVTDTQDQAGKILEVKSGCPSLAVIEQALAAMTGPIEQIPPMVSAVKYKGRRLYELARKGQEVPRRPRRATIHCLRLVEVRPQMMFLEVPLADIVGEFTPANRIDPVPEGSGGRIMFEVWCSRGTYVRTLCHDLGKALGCGAYMSFLLRTRSGPFLLHHAKTLEEWEEIVDKAGSAEGALEYALPIEFGLPGMPLLTVDDRQSRRLGHGGAVDVQVEQSQEFALGTKVFVKNGAGREVCIAQVATRDEEKVRLQPVKVLI